MKQRAILLLFLSILFATTHVAQEAVTHSYQQKGASFSYAQYSAMDSVRDKLIIALADTAGGAWKPAAWAQELSWFADRVKACVIAPEPTFGTFSEDAIIAFVSRSFPQADSTKIRFIALGTGANSMCGLLQAGYSGIMISPMKACGLTEVEQANVVGLLSTRRTDSTSVWKDSLYRTGRWVREIQITADDPYYFERKEEVLMELWNWMDERLTAIQDSTWCATYETTLLSKVPEVVREGKYVELELQIAEPGDVEIDLLDLSARSVHQTHVFLGKGKHSFRIPTKGLNWGVYKLEVDGPGMIEKHRIMIRG